jgi:hypothetical protein
MAAMGSPRRGRWWVGVSVGVAMIAAVSAASQQSQELATPCAVRRRRPQVGSEVRIAFLDVRQ